eukprot:tig00020614_g12134.t1
MGASGSKEFTPTGALEQQPVSSVFKYTYGAASGSKDPNARDVVISVCEKAGQRDVDKAALTAAANAAFRLKTTRHPNIVKYINSQTTPSAVYIITEPFESLHGNLSSLSKSEVLLGLLQIARALAFLESTNLAHNAVTLDAIVVSAAPTRDWKLADLSFCCSRGDDASADALCSLPLRGLRPPSTIPPEDGRPAVAGGAHARDAWCFGKLLESLLPLVATLPRREVEPIIARLCHNDPAQRPRMADVVKDPLFDDEAVRIAEFLDTITLQAPAAKAAFFAGLAGRVAPLAPRSVTRVLLPRFLSPAFLTEPSVGPFLPSLFAPAVPAGMPEPPAGLAEVRGVVPWGEYKESVLPFLLASCGSRSRAVRLVLAECLHVFVSLIPPGALRGEVLGSALVGLRDTSAELVAASISSLLVLSWRLLQLDAEARSAGPAKLLPPGPGHAQQQQPWGPREGLTLVNTRITPELCRVATTDGEAGVRVQALHALGGLWFLSPHAGTNRMLNALKAGLQDPAREVRIAALRALAESKEAQSPWTAALRVMPLALPLLVDPDAEVRGHAHAALGELLRHREAVDGFVDPAECVLPARDGSDFVPRAPLAGPDALEGSTNAPRPSVSLVVGLPAVGPSPRRPRAGPGPARRARRPPPPEAAPAAAPRRLRRRPRAAACSASGRHAPGGGLAELVARRGGRRARREARALPPLPPLPPVPLLSMISRNLDRLHAFHRPGKEAQAWLQSEFTRELNTSAFGDLTEEPSFSPPLSPREGPGAPAPAHIDEPLSRPAPSAPRPRAPAPAPGPTKPVRETLYPAPRPAPAH